MEMSSEPSLKMKWPGRAEPPRYAKYYTYSPSFLSSLASRSAPWSSPVAVWYSCEECWSIVPVLYAPNALLFAHMSWRLYKSIVALILAFFCCRLFELFPALLFDPFAAWTLFLLVCYLTWYQSSSWGRVPSWRKESFASCSTLVHGSLCAGFAVNFQQVKHSDLGGVMAKSVTSSSAAISSSPSSSFIPNFSESTKLDGKNYYQWKVKIHNHLVAWKLWRLVTWGDTKPTEVVDQ